MLDEGHKIKNPTKTTKAANAIAAKHRFILTGTPIQNNLKVILQLFSIQSVLHSNLSTATAQGKHKKWSLYIDRGSL